MKLPHGNTRSFFVFVGIFLLVGSLPLAAADLSKSLSGNLNMRVYLNDVSGNENLSFKTEGPGFLSDLYFNYDRMVGRNDEIHLTGSAYIQSTDDPQFKIREDEVRFQNGYVTAEKSQEWKVTAGYYNDQFTQYTLNTTLLGLNAVDQLTDSIELRTFWGRTRRHQPNQQYDRFGWGSRLAWTPQEGQTLGLNYTRVKDNLGSLDANENNVSDTIDNRLLSIDYEGRWSELGLSMNGEFAESDYDTFTTTEVDGAEARLLKGSWQANEKTRFRAKYEKVDPNFRTDLGFATADRLRKRLNLTRTLMPSLSLSAEYEQWEDGVENATRTNDVTNQRVDFDYNPEMEGLWEISGELGWEARENDEPANESDETIYDLSLTNAYSSHEFTLDYYREDDDVDTEVTGRWNGTLESEFGYGGFPMKVASRGLYEEQDNDQGPTSAVDRTVRINNEFILGYDESESMTLQYGYENEHSDADQEIVTDEWRLEYAYTFSRKTGDRVTVAYDLSDVKDKGNANQNFREETVEANVSVSF